MRDSRRLLFSILQACALVAAVRADAGPNPPIVNCPTGGNGDGIDRGFYVQNYGTGTLGTVTVVLSVSGAAGAYSVSMTAHAGAYNGPVIGTPQTGNFTETGGPVTFDFGNAAVTPGSTIAFVMAIVSVPSGATVFHNDGPCGLGDVTCSSCPGVVETGGTSPPLDTFRRNSVALVITGQGATAATVVPSLQPAALAGLALALALVAFVVLRRPPV